MRECRLTLSSNLWGFAQEFRTEIALHWSERSAANPAFFNGRVLVLERFDLKAGVLEGQFLETDFANFLYWKDGGCPQAAAIDGFGSALIRARGGEVLLARQKAGNVNAGLVYMPGGFIDPRDVRGDGAIDIDASVSRELEEETGLSAAEFTRMPGYLVTVMPGQVSIAIEFVSELEAEALRALLLDKLAAQVDPELEDFIIYSAPPTAGDEDVVAFSRSALAAVLR